MKFGTTKSSIFYGSIKVYILIKMIFKHYNVGTTQKNHYPEQTFLDDIYDI